MGDRLGVGEGLQPGALAHGQGSVLVRVGVAAVVTLLYCVLMLMAYAGRAGSSRPNRLVLSARRMHESGRAAGAAG